MERSFARGARYGMQHARWRRLWRVQIQEYLTASVQNLMVLLKVVKELGAAVDKSQVATNAIKRKHPFFQQQHFYFKARLLEKLDYFLDQSMLSSLAG